MVANILILLGLFVAETGAPRPGPGAAAAKPVTAPATPAALEPAPALTPVDEDAASAARTAAQRALADGNRRLKEGDVAGALADYRRAQTIYPPAADKIEFNIAKAEETRGDEPAAAAAFERFLSQALEIPPEYREEARNELRRLSAALGALRLAEKHPGYDVLVDGRDHGKTPLPGDVWVRPGHHVITLEQDHHVLFRDDVEVDGGGTVQVTVTIRQTASPVASPSLTASALAAPAPSVTKPAGTLVASTPPAPGEPSGADQVGPPIWKRWWFWTAAGALVVSGAAIVLLSTRDSCPSGVSCRTVSIPPGP
jgi:PEGA domain-containing protein